MLLIYNFLLFPSKYLFRTLIELDDGAMDIERDDRVLRGTVKDTVQKPGNITIFPPGFL